MHLLNLSFLEFSALFAAISGAAVALYLLDRSRHKVRVATLRFWRPSEKPPVARHRKRIQQPWSLLLQILGMLLLLAALAQLRWGSPQRSSRDHVLLMDVSAWTAAKADPRRRLIDEEKFQAVRWLRALPSTDRVMLVRAGSLPEPVTGFETSRSTLEQEILRTEPGGAALNLRAAFEFARRMQRRHGAGSGEVVFTGAGRSHPGDLPSDQDLPPALRLLPVEVPARNVGIRRFHLRRSPGDAQLWEVFVAIRNYGRRSETVPLVVTFGNAPIGSGRLNIAPGAEETARYEFRTRSAGWMEAKLQFPDAMASDNTALIEIPEQKVVRVAAFTRQPEALRPLLNANPRLQTAFAPPEAYRADAEADLILIDRFAPPAPPTRPSLWIAPWTGKGPVAIQGSPGAAKITRWHAEHPIARGLNVLDLPVENAVRFAVAEGLSTVAESGDGALLLTRSQPRAVFLGFHPGLGAMKYELTAPLLMANLLEWLAPGALGRWEMEGESAGTVRANLESGTDPASIEVVGPDGQPLPFSFSDNLLQFYAAEPGTVRVRAGGRETVYSLSLPDVGEVAWEAPARIRRGLGRIPGEAPHIPELWPWLALLGGALLAAEWYLYGRLRLPGAPAPGLPDALRRWIPPFRRAA